MLQHQKRIAFTTARVLIACSAPAAALIAPAGLTDTTSLIRKRSRKCTYRNNSFVAGLAPRKWPMEGSTRAVPGTPILESTASRRNTVMRRYFPKGSNPRISE